MDEGRSGHQMTSNAFATDRVVQSKHNCIPEAVTAVAVFGTLPTSV